jgi:hypothetical protein
MALCCTLHTYPTDNFSRMYTSYDKQSRSQRLFQNFSIDRFQIWMHQTSQLFPHQTKDSQPAANTLFYISVSIQAFLSSISSLKKH